jgi:hypothetical protein
LTGNISLITTKKLAVQLSIETFQKTEEVLENYALFQLMDEENGETLNASEAKAYYKSLKNES